MKQFFFVLLACSFFSVQAQSPSKWSVELLAGTDLVYGDAYFADYVQYQWPTNDYGSYLSNSLLSAHIALQANYQFHPKWSLTSGLQLNRIRSQALSGHAFCGLGVPQEFFPNPDFTHYVVGLPLRINYKLVNQRRFVLEPLLGVVFNYNVNSQIELEQVEIVTPTAFMNIQWGAAIGVPLNETTAIRLIITDEHRVFERYVPSAIRFSVGVNVNI